jgi:hypothetical protein
LTRLRRALRGAIGRFATWLDDDSSLVRGSQDDEFGYAELNSIMSTMLREGHRASYVWGSLQGLALARALRFDRVSLIEFGVAGGCGLVALERIAERAEKLFSVAVDVWGFDTGEGHPAIRDYRDAPNLMSTGMFRMDQERLRGRLRRSKLVLGDIKDTIGEFSASNPAPIGFIACDLDLYTSTMSTLRVLDASEHLLLPRICCYFDDVLGFTWGDHNGERLAIHEFNATHRLRKISPIYGLKHYVPRECFNDMWVEKYWMAHIFEHSKYGVRDHNVKQHTLALSE